VHFRWTRTNYTPFPIATCNASTVFGMEEEGMLVDDDVMHEVLKSTYDAEKY
jgi:hypothetical protein